MRNSRAGNPAPSGCPRPILAVINGRLPRKQTQSLVAALKNIGADVARTTYAGHAIEIARQGTSYRTLIAAGGDGTVSEVATGMDPSSHYLAVLPAGRANCIAGALGIRSIAAGMRVLSSGSVCRIDVMETAFVDSRRRRQARRLVGFAACGLEADIARRVREAEKVPHFLRRACASLAATARLRPFAAHLTVNDGKELETRLSTLLVSNCGCGIFACALPWDLCDGAAEALMVRRSMLGQMIRNVKRLANFPPSRHWRAGVKKLACRFDAPVTMAGDGEVFAGVTALAMAIAPQNIRLIAPSGGPIRHPKWK
jgi:diacylglycerol kinase family enzyme